MDRRLFLSGLTASAAMASSPAGFAAPRSGARIPGEFEPMAAVWVGDDPSQPAMRLVSARIAEALTPYVRVKIASTSEEEAEGFRAFLTARGVDVSDIEFHHHAKAPYFIRDYNLFGLDDRGRLSAVDFQWNTYGLRGWCGDHLYPGEPARAERCAAYHDDEKGLIDRWMAGRTGAGVVPSSLYLEGGAIEVNGRGVLLVSEPLALQRNPGRDRAALEQAFLEAPGIRKVVWLQQGLAEDPHMMATITGRYVGYGTGGHVDEFARFANPSTILLAWVGPDAEHPVDRINQERMRRNFELLSDATDADGRPFTIVKVPLPRPIEREVVVEASTDDWLGWPISTFPARENRKVGDRLIHVAAASYLNYLVANGVVLLPDYTADGTPVAAQEEVRTIFQSAFPGRDIRFIDATRLNWSGGGIHCATCSEPASAS